MEFYDDGKSCDNYPNAQVEISVNNQDTDLHFTAKMGNEIRMQALLIAGANINAKNDEGLTALQMASQKGHQSIVELLREGT